MSFPTPSFPPQNTIKHNTNWKCGILITVIQNMTEFSFAACMSNVEDCQQTSESVKSVLRLFSKKVHVFLRKCFQLNKDPVLCLEDQWITRFSPVCELRDGKISGERVSEVHRGIQKIEAGWLWDIYRPHQKDPVRLSLTYSPSKISFNTGMHLCTITAPHRQTARIIVNICAAACTNILPSRTHTLSNVFSIFSYCRGGSWVFQYALLCQKERNRFRHTAISNTETADSA